MKENTYNACKRMVSDGEEIACQQRRFVVVDKGAPIGGAFPCWCWCNPVTAQDLADCFMTDRVGQFLQLARNAVITPVILTD